MLSEEQVIHINRRFTGQGLLLNRSLLGSAFSSYLYYAEPQIQACSIFLGLIQNHAFADGNKRTAFTAFNIVRRSLKLNMTKSQDELFQIIIYIATNKITPEEVSEKLFEKNFQM